MRRELVAGLHDRNTIRNTIWLRIRFQIGEYGQRCKRQFDWRVGDLVKVGDTDEYGMPLTSRTTYDLSVLDSAYGCGFYGGHTSTVHTSVARIVFRILYKEYGKTRIQLERPPRGWAGNEGAVLEAEMRKLQHCQVRERRCSAAKRRSRNGAFFCPHRR
jgi:hypothetical protein